MSEPILSVPLRRKRDVLIGRQRARQLAGLLGYDRGQQVQIAAAVFELAATFLGRQARGRLLFHAGSGMFRVVTEPVVFLGLERPLPAGVLDMASGDIAWAAGALHDLTPLDVYEEMVQLNRELVEALAEQTAYNMPVTEHRSIVRPAA